MHGDYFKGQPAGLPVRVYLKHPLMVFTRLKRQLLLDCQNIKFMSINTSLLD